MLENIRLLSHVTPGHYSKWELDPVSFIMLNDIPFAEGNVIKYVMRHRDKDGVKDIDKAIRYLQMIKEKHYGKAE